MLDSASLSQSWRWENWQLHPGCYWIVRRLTTGSPRVEGGAGNHLCVVKACTKYLGNEHRHIYLMTLFVLFWLRRKPLHSSRGLNRLLLAATRNSCWVQLSVCLTRATTGSFSRLVSPCKPNPKRISWKFTNYYCDCHQSLVGRVSLIRVHRHSLTALRADQPL